MDLAVVKVISESAPLVGVIIGLIYLLIHQSMNSVSKECYTDTKNHAESLDKAVKELATSIAVLLDRGRA